MTRICTGSTTRTETLIPGTTDDDGGAGYNARVTFTAEEAGAYYVAAGAWGYDTGTYHAVGGGRFHVTCAAATGREGPSRRAMRWPTPRSLTMQAGLAASSPGMRRKLLQEGAHQLRIAVVTSARQTRDAAGVTLYTGVSGKRP